MSLMNIDKRDASRLCMDTINRRRFKGADRDMSRFEIAKMYSLVIIKMIRDK